MEKHNIKQGIKKKLENNYTNGYIAKYNIAIEENPVLTEEEERALMKKLRDSEKLLSKIKKIYEKTSDKNEVEKLKKLEQKIEKEYNTVKEKIILSNLKLVISIAQGYHTNHLKLNDLIQEGIIGLNKGIEKFDYKKANKLSTYVVFWIYQSIERAIHEKEHEIRVSEGLVLKKNQYHRAIEEYKAKNFKDPTEEEIKEITGFSDYVINVIKHISNPVIALERTIHDDSEKITLKDSLKDETLTPDEQINAKTDIKQLNEIIKILDDRSLYIIKARCGYYGKEMTLEEIGKELNLTRERVRQLENSALRKLKNRCGDSLKEMLNHREKISIYSNSTRRNENYEEDKNKAVIRQR